MDQTCDILYYEVLDIPLPELQGLKTLKVAFYHATKNEVSSIVLCVIFFPGVAAGRGHPYIFSFFAGT